MVYLFGSPRCFAPQSLSVSCNKFGKSKVHTNLTYLETKPVRSSRNCRALPPIQAHNLKKSTNKIQATKQSKASLLFETLEPDKPNNSSIPFSRVILQAVKVQAA